MNYSSVLITTLPENQEELIDKLEQSKLCEVYLSSNGQIIVILEGRDTEEEITKLRKLESFDKVISAVMIYSYVEDHIEDLRKSLELSDDIPEILNDENIKAEEIKYSGDVKD